MSYRDKIERCNDRALANHSRFVIEDRTVGWIAPHRVEALAALKLDCLSITSDGVRVAQHLDTPERRAQALGMVAPDIVASGGFAKLQDEPYPIKNDWRDATLGQIDRGLAPGFGIRAYGVHLNGYVRTPRGLSLWMGVRSRERRVAPGQFDNLVAGGQPAHLSLEDNLIKECAEEAGIGPELAARARPAGAIRYAFTTKDGLRNDTMFCFDLELPPGVQPVSVDGEVERFELIPLDDVMAMVRSTDRIKFNVNLVLIDFALRHGAIGDHHAAERAALAAALNNPLPMD